VVSDLGAVRRDNWFCWLERNPVLFILSTSEASESVISMLQPGNDGLESNTCTAAEVMERDLPTKKERDAEFAASMASVGQSYCFYLTGIR
jgi:hypothetical protein